MHGHQAAQKSTAVLGLGLGLSGPLPGLGKKAKHLEEENIKIPGFQAKMERKMRVWSQTTVNNAVAVSLVDKGGVNPLSPLFTVMTAPIPQHLLCARHTLRHL